MGYHFISYSAVDAAAFAVRLVDTLAAHRPAVRVWLDQRELKPGLDWDEQIGDAIKTCDSLLFVMSRDSVTPNSVCKREWTLALKYNKPVIPLRLHADAELPFRLEPRQFIDCSGEIAPALTRLHGHLLWLSEPQGRLQQLKDRLADAVRGLSRTPAQDRPRLLEEIAELERQIVQQQTIVDDPLATAPVAQAGSLPDRDLGRSDQQETPQGDAAWPSPAVRRPRQATGGAAAHRAAEAPVGHPEDRRIGQPAARHEARAGVTEAWDPRVLEQARHELATYIGPMARVIVRDAAQRASSLEELYTLLAAEIEAPSDREKFLASRPR